MEKPTFIAIDYNSYENKVIEERVRNYYQEVKNIFEIVLIRRIKNPGSLVGLCGDFTHLDYRDKLNTAEAAANVVMNIMHSGA